MPGSVKKFSSSVDFLVAEPVLLRALLAFLPVLIGESYFDDEAVVTFGLGTNSHWL